MKVAILGSGNGGHAVAFDCAKAGHDVYLFDFPQFSKNVDVISKVGGIYSEGCMEGFQKIAYAGTNLEVVLKGAKMIFVVAPSYATEPIAKACKPYIEDGQTYIVMPSSCMGALVFKQALGLDVKDYRITVADTNTLPYAVRIIEPGKIEVYNRLKTAYSIATLPRNKGDEVYEVVKEIFDGIEKFDSILQTTLSNSNPIIHPVVTTLNAGLIERTKGDFEFYHEGITPAVGNLMEAVDMERLKIGEGLGLFIEKSTKKGVRQGYFDKDTDDYSLAYSTAPGFKGVKAQPQLDHRYYNEDLAYTTVFWIDLADHIGVDVPNLKALVTIISSMMKHDYMENPPRTLETLGLGKFTREDLLEL